MKVIKSRECNICPTFKRSKWRKKAVLMLTVMYRSYLADAVLVIHICPQCLTNMRSLPKNKKMLGKVIGI